MVLRDGRAIAWGYNGAPPGLPHCDHPVDEICDNATHAEANAIAFAARQGISTDGAILLVGVSPCEGCARLIIAAGISEVYFREAYRDVSGVDLLRQASIETYHVYDA